MACNGEGSICGKLMVEQEDYEEYSNMVNFIRLLEEYFETYFKSLQHNYGKLSSILSSFKSV
jgi:hypothetical protein